MLDWRTARRLRARGVGFATLTHAAGLSSTGDAELDARLPFDEPYRLPAATVAAIAAAPRARRSRRRDRHDGRARPRTRGRRNRAGCAPGAGVATQRLGRRRASRVVDAIVSGTHEPGTSHHELLRAFVGDATLRADRRRARLASPGYRTHEFGDSVLVERGVTPRTYVEPRSNLNTATLASRLGQRAHDPAGLDAERVEDRQAVLARQDLEVGVGADADVRRVVPLVGQHARHRHAAGGDVQAVRPVREVRKADDADAADARRLAQHLLGVAQVLQRVELQHDVEAAVLEQRQPFLEVELDDVDAALRAGEHVGVGDLDAVAAAAALALQQGEQLAVAAAEVEHARAGRHQLGDQLDVLAIAHAQLLARALREAGAQHPVVARIVEQEGVVAVRRVDLGVADVAPVVDQRLDDLARARRREAPVGREADELELAARRRERRASGRRRARAPGRSSRARG